jgi:hypothetical protein
MSHADAIKTFSLSSIGLEMDRGKSHLITILSKRHGQKDPDVST